MLDKDLQQKIVDRVSNVVKAEEEEAEEEHVRDHEITKGPVVPPATKVSIETQTDPQPESEEPAAPEKKPVPMEYYGQDISGHETDSILRKLNNCFKKDYHGEWAGFYSQGFPASSQHRHMLWHSQFRQAEKAHENYWYQDTEGNLMKEYVNRHYDESVLNVLEELRRDAIYSCSDPRLPIKEREQVNKFTNKEDFENLH